MDGRSPTRNRTAPRRIPRSNFKPSPCDGRVVTDGDEEDADQPRDDQPDGDETNGDETNGDETNGDETNGDETNADETNADETNGDETIGTDGRRGGDERDEQRDIGRGSTDNGRQGSEPIGPRHDRLTRHPTPGRRNSLWSWTDARHPLRVARNYAFIVAARHAPSLRLKNWLLRRIGVDVGRGVAWGLESTPDVFWPELVTVEDDAIVGYDATLLCHEFLQDEYRTGEVWIGERAMIGAGTVVLPGVEIGADAQVAANSLVAEDVPPGETWAGVPAVPMADAIDEPLDEPNEESTDEPLDESNEESTDEQTNEPLDG